MTVVRVFSLPIQNLEILFPDSLTFLVLLSQVIAVEALYQDTAGWKHHRSLVESAVFSIPNYPFIIKIRILCLIGNVVVVVTHVPIQHKICFQYDRQAHYKRRRQCYPPSNVNFLKYCCTKLKQANDQTIGNSRYTLKSQEPVFNY